MNRDYFIGLNNRDPYVWAREGGIKTVEYALQSNYFTVLNNDLKLVVLFKESTNI